MTERLNDKNVQFVSKKEDIDTKTAAGKFILTIFGAVAELELEYNKQRQREVIEIAKVQGKEDAIIRLTIAYDCTILIYKHNI